MKVAASTKQEGSVLITTFLTMTILTMICATSLYVASQNQNCGSQTSSWQQALSGAEAGIDLGVRALNTATWTLSPAPSPGGQWYTATKPTGTAFPTTLPPYTPTPSPAATAGGVPAVGTYNYYVFGSNQPGAISMNGVSSSTSSPEGNPTITGWVTIDTASLTADSNGQWFRLRSTGVAATNGFFRASNNRLDNDLRHTIGIRFNRKTNQALGSAQATRTIEVIMEPLTNALLSRAVTLQSTITMSGGGVIDSFDSSNPFKSTGGLYDSAKRQSNGSVATTNSGNNSDLSSTYIYGSLAYSGSPVKNTTHVQGTISTPFSVTIPTPSDPTWASGSYTPYSSGMPFTAITAGSKANPKLVKVNGDFTLSGSNFVTISSDPLNIGTDNNYITIWVTGKLTTSGSSYVTQDSRVKVTWIVDSDITASGSSFQNNGGTSANLTIIGVGTGNKVTISGGGALVGVINAPGSDVTISGTGSLNGSIIANTLNISGGASVHYDQALYSSGSSAIGNYAFASWFEDNSDPKRKDVNSNYIIY